MKEMDQTLFRVFRSSSQFCGSRKSVRDEKGVQGRSLWDAFIHPSGLGYPSVVIARKSSFLYSVLRIVRRGESQHQHP
jgi:hypothetical protein